MTSTPAPTPTTASPASPTAEDHGHVVCAVCRNPRSPLDIDHATSSGNGGAVCVCAVVVLVAGCVDVAGAVDVVGLVVCPVLGGFLGSLVSGATVPCVVVSVVAGAVGCGVVSVGTTCVVAGVVVVPRRLALPGSVFFPEKTPSPASTSTTDPTPSTPIAPKMIPRGGPFFSVCAVCAAAKA